MKVIDSKKIKEIFKTNKNSFTYVEPPFFSQFADRITWGDFNYLFNIGIKYKYVYAEVAKSACSTIKYRLLLQENLLTKSRDIKVIEDQIHAHIEQCCFRKPYQFQSKIGPLSVFNKTLTPPIFGKKFFRFTFLRNPVERLLSAYLDKIKRGQEIKQSQPSQQAPIYEMFLKHYLPEHKSSQKNVSFSEFIDAIDRFAPKKNLDIHWRPQSELILHGQIPYNFVGCFERFEEDWSKLSTIIKFRDQHHHSFNSHRTTAKEKIDDMVSPKVRKKIEKIYAKDIEIYQNLLKDGPEFLQ